MAPAPPSPPTASSSLILTFPTPAILLITLNRPQQLNSLTNALHHELASLWTWYDATPSLRCAIITGARPPAGSRFIASFCAGQDLKEWNSTQSASGPRGSHPESGFGGLSQRRGKKPVIAAVSGVALGGGLEMLANADMVVATVDSTFGLPEARVGVVAFSGALPRLAMALGLQRASEMALAGRVLSAREAERWGLVNRVVEEGEDVVATAVEMARKVCRSSPDSVVVSRAGLRSAWYMGNGVDRAVKDVWDGVGAELQEGENIKEGLRAFVEKRKPRWKDSKL